jgi:hypothetical protein
LLRPAEKENVNDLQLNSLFDLRRHRVMDCGAPPTISSGEISMTNEES